MKKDGYNRFFFANRKEWALACFWSRLDKVAEKKGLFCVIFECHKSALVGQYFKVIGIHGGEGGLPTGGPNYKGEGRALIHGNVGNAKFEKSKKKSEKSEMGKSKIPQ